MVEGLSTDYIVLLILLAVQAWISAELWRVAGKRARGFTLLAARCGIAVFFAVVLTCYFFSISRFTARTGIQGPALLVLGAVALLYTATMSALALVVVIGRKLRRHLNADADPGRRRVLHAAGGVAMAAPFAALAYGTLVQRTNFQVREADVQLPGLADGLDGLRILQLSDIHLSPFLTEAELARVVDASRELRPNLAVITGDLISGPGDPLDACLRQLSRLRADAGIYGCMGNHEHYARVENYAEAQGARLGIQFLRGAARQLRFGGAILNLAGVDYQSLVAKALYIRNGHRLIAPGACNVLLSHNPDVLPAAARQGWNFVLSGHTHGGQVTVEILDETITPIRFLTSYVYGLYRSGGAAGYVTRGIGTIGIPARLGAPPEIALLTLRKA